MGLWNARIKNYVIILISYLVCFTPAFSLFVWLVYIVKEYPNNFDLLFTLKLTIAAAVATFCCSMFFDGYVLISFLRTFFVQLEYLRRPIVNGSIFGLMTLAVFYLLFYNKNPQSYDTLLTYSFTIYLSGSGIFIAIDYFYREHLPISQLDLFLRELTKDLKDNLKNENADFIFCYPGLSLGSISIGGKIYDKYYSAMNDFIKMGSPKSTFILTDYNEELKQLYEKYKEEIDKETDQKLKNKQLEGLNVAHRDSSHLQASVIKSSGSCKGEYDRNNEIRITSTVTWYFVDTKFRFQAVIIGDIVYLLTTFGLPTKIGNKWYDTLGPHNAHVEIVATRIKNRLLALQFRDQIIKEADQYNKHLYNTTVTTT